MHRRSLTIFRPYANEQSGSKSNHWLWRRHEKWKAGAKKSHYFCCLRNLNALCNNWMAFSTLFSGGSTADKLSRKNNKPSLDWQNEKKHIRHSQTTTHLEPKAMTQPQWLKFTSALQIMSFVGSIWTRRTKPEVCHWMVLKTTRIFTQWPSQRNTSLPWACWGCNLWVFSSVQGFWVSTPSFCSLGVST